MLYICVSSVHQEIQWYEFYTGHVVERRPVTQQCAVNSNV